MKLCQPGPRLAKCPGECVETIESDDDLRRI
jgi:hypothetical protein